MRTHLSKPGITRPVLGISALLLVLVSGSTLAEPWSFGVMSDTQWKENLDGENPETVAVGIINQLTQQFIEHGVKFVIQVGDLVDKETDSTNGNSSERTMDTRAAAAQTLYDNGICFFPLRGNHEGSSTAANEMPVLFPQTTGGGMTCGVTNINSPDPYDNGNLTGLSYSFDYDNARFVLIDQFTRKDGTNYLDSSNYNAIDQLPWIDSVLSDKGIMRHGFLFSHKNLMGANHVDMLLGSDPSQNPEAQNSYFASLYDNGARYHFGGHDHNHLRSVVVSPDGLSTAMNIITSSNSYKFYTPKIPSIDEQYDLPAFGFLRETPITQELYTVGYYIVTVDGPRVTVDHYASPNDPDGANDAYGETCGTTFDTLADCDLKVTPNLSFEKRETFGYSLNGREFLVAQGDSYSVVRDSFRGTRARILGGTNDSTVTILDGRSTTKDVNTGWAPRKAILTKEDDNTASATLTLWGMKELGEETSDTYALSLSYQPSKGILDRLGRGLFGLATKDADGNWINAVDMIDGVTKRFVLGTWKPSYPLGTYGVDTRTKTAWAVINYDGDFAVAGFDLSGDAARDGSANR